MRLPSLSKLFTDARETLVRFPFVIAAGAVFALVLISDTDDTRYPLTAALAIPFLFSITLFAERMRWGAAGKALAGLVGVGLLVLYCFSFSDPLNSVDRIRFLLFFLCAHLLAAFAPYTVRDQLNGFWQYNKAIFIRVLAAGLYTGVLFAGLSLALLAVDKLFGVEVQDKVYEDLAALLGGVFSTWFFLAGVPRDFNALQESEAYPGALKIFTQYVLLPLVTIYLIILYLYSAKIFINWELPIGWVSTLILGFSVAGVLSLLLLYPIRNREGNRWIMNFYGLFYWALLPLIVLLFMAISRRVNDYGITEPRYFVYGLAVWLAGITLYFLIRGRENIKMIPISLFAAALLSTFGPWSAFAVSSRSQMARLEKILTENRLLVDGKIAGRVGEQMKGSYYSVWSIIDFLRDRGELERLRPWLREAPAGDLTEEVVLKEFGLEGDVTAMTAGADNLLNLMSDRGAIDISGYQSMVNYDFRREPQSPLEVRVGDDSLTIDFRDEDHSLVVTSQRGDSVSFPIGGFSWRLRDSLIAAEGWNAFGADGSRTLSADSLMMTGSMGTLGAKLYIMRLHATRSERDTVFSMLETQLLLRTAPGIDTAR